RVVGPEGHVNHFAGQKTGMLLSYLAYYAHRRHPREQLTELLWQGSTPGSSRLNLRVTLAALRAELGEVAGFLIADRVSVGLDSASFATDVSECEAALPAVATATDEDLRQRHLTTAVSLYRGELLEGFYEDWISPERARLAERFLGALRQLASACERA